MEIPEYFTYREYLLDESKDEDGFISDSAFLNICLPSLNETRLIDSESCNESFCVIEKEYVRIDGYLVNESGERLQVFIINEDSIDLSSSAESLQISQKSYYEKHFNRALNFVKKAIKKQLENLVQDSSPARPIISFLGSSEAMDQIDVVEIFLISATATVETRSETPSPKRLEFEDDSFKVSFSQKKLRHEKELIVVKRLVDLNFLYNVVVSQGNREVLKIDFTNAPFNYRINCIQAADEENFESYLCVLPGQLLAELYKKYSSRMLEKNVRSFLQLKGVNKGMQDTISKTPEKFIAYNNGLTITATGKELVKEHGATYLKSLTDFQIVNGGQTTATIYFSKKGGLDVGKISVMAKVNVAKNATEEELDELISNISTFSNAQSRVSKVDLRSRSSQLVKLKSLSESVLTPSSKKWFFERAKGEFNTIIRKNPQQKSRINREYPKERRFTKEELAKYHTSWGEKPYLVKKGGEKVFRFFIEEITGEDKRKIGGVEIDRAFYENLIAKIILFRTLEKIYGSGPRAIGQIRSAVVPYSISVLHKYINGSKSGYQFDLFKIWKSEGLEDDLQDFFKSLMKQMNELIKKYSASDDYGEYSKKDELWQRISECNEIKEFVESKNFLKIADKYSVSKELLKKRGNRKANTTANFEPLSAIVKIYSNSQFFYKDILRTFGKSMKDSERSKLEHIIGCIQNHSDITAAHVSFERELIEKIRRDNPDFFDNLKNEPEDLLPMTFDFILKQYNKAIESGLDIKSEFELLSEIANRKGAKYYSVFNEIGKDLEQGKLPTIKQLINASNYVQKFIHRN
jgi:hypothetical protein